MPRALALVAVCAALLAGCGGRDAAWEPVPLPGPGRVVTLTGTPGGLLVGRYDEAATERASIRLVQADGTSRPVEMDTRWEWAGREAELLSVASTDGRTVALGGHRAGAHGNVRWTVWSGDTHRVVEQPQRFETFGGWDAGGLVGTAIGPAGPLILGSWVSPSKRGHDVAVWTRSRDRWAQPATVSTALAATTDRQPSPGAVTALPVGYLAVGWVTELEPQIRDVAVLWTATTPRGPWREMRLPADGASVARPSAVSCVDDHCAVAGRRDDDVVLWRVGLTGGRPTQIAAPTTITAGTLRTQSPSIAVVAGAVDTLAHSEGGSTRVVRWVGTGASEDLPGRLTAMAPEPGGRIVIATTDAQGASRAWRSPPSPARP